VTINAGGPGEAGLGDGRLGEGSLGEGSLGERGVREPGGHGRSGRIHASRRALLRHGLLLGAAAFLPGSSGGVAFGSVLEAAPPSGTSAEAPALPITLAQWSLHRTIFGGALDAVDFPVAAARCGIRGVEYVNQFYADQSDDRRWIAELKRRCDDHGVRSHLIMCDGLGDVGDPDPTARVRAVEAHDRWLDAAAALGCHAIRVNARSSGSLDEQRERLVDGLARLCERAGSRSLSVLVENHGGASSDGVWLAGVLRAVGRPELGTLPDFGNFRVDAETATDRYAGVEALMPLARAVSAKSYDFDQAGDETTIDYPRMLRIVRAAGYRGAVGIEYEGKRLSEAQGIQATKRLLERLGCVA
jgi:sugar phosphate isomerase/epimerase